jgi:hypothetical protein
VSAGQDGDDAKIREAFAAYFKDFDIRLPAEIPAAGGLIKQAGWNIRYAVGRDGGRSYLELYAMNRMTNDRHLRVYEDGTVETLGTVSQGVTFNPDVPGDRERAERDRKAADDRLIADLRRKGLW